MVWVPWDSEPRITVLARAISNLALSLSVFEGLNLYICTDINIIIIIITLLQLGVRPVAIGITTIVNCLRTVKLFQNREEWKMILLIFWSSNTPCKKRDNIKHRTCYYQNHHLNRCFTLELWFIRCGDLLLYEASFSKDKEISCLFTLAQRSCCRS
jgi:hypothetical protein